MAGNQVPNNIEDPTILKRFLTDLVSGLNTNPYYSGNVSALQEAIVSALSNSTSSVDFLNTLSTITELRTDILKYIEDNLETVILQNQEDVALIAEQYGAFYDQALAASWYGLSVKAGGAIAGLEVGSLDPDVTTPGDESSYFRIIADNFVLGRAYEDLSVEEKAYLSTNGLPAFGTVYNADKTPMPAIVTSWDNINKVYKHFFNGIVQFSNISGADYASAINNGTTTINGGKITTNTLGANTLTPSTGASTIWAGGGLVSQNFNGNAAGSIGSPTLGFRLSSNAAGTSADPTIYGAYIKGATLEGTSLTINDVKVKAAGYSLNFGDLLILKTYHLSEARPPITSFKLFSDTYIARSYSSGYNALRMCATTQVFEITCTLNCDSAYIKNLYLHYSTDGTNYTLLDSVQNSSNTSIVLISKSHYHSTTNNITFKVSGDTYYGGSGTNLQNLLLSLSVKSTNNSG